MTVRLIRRIFPILLSLLLFSGCSGEEDLPITRISFVRGHGSTWGSQLTVTLTPDRIEYLAVFPQETPGELAEYYDLPLSSSDWQAAVDAVSALSPKLEKERKGILPQKTDGDVFKKLTLSIDTGGRIKETGYRIPDCSEATVHENLLEELALRSIP